MHEYSGQLGQRDDHSIGHPAKFPTKEIKHPRELEYKLQQFGVYGLSSQAPGSRELPPSQLLLRAARLQRSYVVIDFDDGGHQAVDYGWNASNGTFRKPSDFKHKQSHIQSDFL